MGLLCPGFIFLCSYNFFGQVGLRTIWEKYYEEANAIIYVIDASSPNSFEDAKSALGWSCLFLK
jgi:ADP-ribosylation factor related protein 1